MTPPGFIKKGLAKLSKKSKPKTECPICAGLYCAQTGQQEATTTPKKICSKCMEELHCKLHDKKQHEHSMSQLGMHHQWYRFKDVKTPKCRKKIYLGEDRVV